MLNYWQITRLTALPVAHFGGTTVEAWYVYIERDFSGNAMSAPIRQFGTDGAYNSAWYQDHLSGAVQQIRYALDGNTATTSSYIVSPVQEMARNLAAPLQVVVMTDALRDSIGSVLIDQPGKAAEPDDGSDFTVYNELKTEGVAFSVVSFNSAAEDIAASARLPLWVEAIPEPLMLTHLIQKALKLRQGSIFLSHQASQLTTEQIDELVEGTAVCSSGISGTIFEDLTYGGGNGQAFASANTVGLPGATVEVYDENGAYVAAVTSGIDGSYKLPNLPDAPYYVRVVNSSISSSRTGSNGSELPVMTYRSDGVTAVTSEIGGRNPAVADATVNAGTSTLDTNTFVFNAGSLLGQQAQSVQAIALTGSSVKNADFGFNFNTIVNANDAGQGSLRQFILNNNLLDSTGIQQTLPGIIASDYQSGDRRICLYDTCQRTDCR